MHCSDFHVLGWTFCECRERVSGTIVLMSSLDPSQFPPLTPGPPQTTLPTPQAASAHSAQQGAASR